MLFHIIVYQGDMVTHTHTFSDTSDPLRGAGGTRQAPGQDQGPQAGPAPCVPKSPHPPPGPHRHVVLVDQGWWWFVSITFIVKYRESNCPMVHGLRLRTNLGVCQIHRFLVHLQHLPKHVLPAPHLGCQTLNQCFPRLPLLPRWLKHSREP